MIRKSFFFNEQTFNLPISKRNRFGTRAFFFKICEKYREFYLKEYRKLKRYTCRCPWTFLQGFDICLSKAAMTVYLQLLQVHQTAKASYLYGFNQIAFKIPTVQLILSSLKKTLPLDGNFLFLTVTCS